MSFLRNILDSLFGGIENPERSNRRSDNYQHHSEHFRNPIWQNDQEDDDDYEDNYSNSSLYRHSGPGFHFEVFTNPLEITRFFESEMENMMKNFFSLDLETPPPFGNSPALSPPHIEEKQSPRDQVLKPGFVSPASEGKNPRVDEDLDGKISARDFSRAWDSPAIPEPRQPTPNSNFNFQFSKSTVFQTIRHPDGAIEEKKIVTDSEGNTETTSRKQIGDKSYTVTTKKDKNGVEIKTENFQNIDEGDRDTFGVQWKQVEEPKIETGSLSKFPWHKFFGPNPKL